METPTEHTRLNGYRPPAFDDAVEADGTPRPWARETLETVLAHDLGALGQAVRDDVHGMGIRFASVDGDDFWHVDPVPRVIPAAEWEAVARGLAQRVVALNAYVADVYGQQRIVTEGAVPLRVIESAEQYDAADAIGARPATASGWGSPASTSCATRRAAGSSSRTTSAPRAGWATGGRAARRSAVTWASAMTAAPRRWTTCRGCWPPRWAPAARSCSPTGRATPPTGSTAGRPSGWRSRVVEPDDLAVRDGRLWHAGSPIDAVYRRSNADELDTTVGRLLHPVLCTGALKLVNCFGTGVADDKLAHAYVDTMIRFYLGEEPLLSSVETFDLAVPEVLERALDTFDELVVKDRGSYGGMGVTVVGHAEDEDVDGLRDRVRADPGAFIAQRRVPSRRIRPRSTASSQPRHVDLRPFVFLPAPDDPRVTAGGITRVALGEGALVVNSSQNGGAKDTWVIG